MLWILILIPLVAAGAVFLLPKEQAKITCLLGMTVGLVAALVAASQFKWDETATFQFADGTLALLPDLGVNLKVGADSVSLWLILLTAFLGPLMALGSFTAISERVKTYYGWLLVLQAAMIGVFAARDLAFFYVCFEFTLVPMYILISLYGSTNRKKAATKFFLYTFTGSILALAGLVYVAYSGAMIEGKWNDAFSFDNMLAAANAMSGTEQGWVLLAMLAGFAVKVPLFPVHTWLPLAHTEAPTAGSVVLAGVLLKLGTYAIYRFVLNFVPDAVAAYAPTIAILAIIGIVYAGLICWVQRDIKKLVAYSSVSHLGFCVLGLVALNNVGLSGSILYMINHGLSTGALFFLIGMMYERYHTRSLREIGGLAKKMPVWAFFMVFFTMASVGLPGLNGFVSEFMCLLGTFQSGNTDLGIGGTAGRLGFWYAAVAGTGMIVAAIYLLAMVGKSCFGPLREPAGHEHHGPLPVDLSTREIAVLVPLALACIWLGVYPDPVIDSIKAPNMEVLERYESIAADPALRAEVDTLVLTMPETDADQGVTR